MKIIISPAKKMQIDTDTLDYIKTPYFINKAEEIKENLIKLSFIEIKKIWGCNDDIAKLNYHRLHSSKLNENLTPAILAYEGIQYKYMAASVFENSQFNYLNENLYILSGMYGALSAFCGVVPYRLEMGAKLKIAKNKDLYQFWGEDIAKYIQKDTDIILNLASEEYSKAVKKHLDKNKKFITVNFCEIKGDKLIQKATLCKMARGEMVRFLAENNIKDIEKVKDFKGQGFFYSKEKSDEETLVFIK